MHRLQLLFVILLLCSTISPAQTASADTQPLQNLVNEVHQLRQDLKSMATAMERGQILFYRLQIQQPAVDRAIQRLDDAREKLEATQSGRRDAVRGYEIPGGQRGFRQNSGRTKREGG